jgi:hypothetical protein
MKFIHRKDAEGAETRRGFFVHFPAAPCGLCVSAVRS